MSGEIKVFKTRVFCGFDRRDVIDYVRALTSERNAHRVKSEENAAETARLREENSALQAETEALRRSIPELKAQAFDDALARIKTLAAVAEAETER
jgi:regulator of replication initiation timing